MGRLVAHFAHDIGNPFGNALMAAGEVEPEMDETRAALAAGTLGKQALQTSMSHSGEGIAMVVRNLGRARELLESFRQQALDQATGEPREIELQAWLADLARQLTPMLAAESHRLELHVAGPLHMQTQPGSLSRVIANLVSNAVLHAFDGRSGGTVTVTAGADDAGRVHIEVADDGAAA